MTVINFYSTKDEYGCFSNFSRHSVKLDGVEWPTTEHYFQAKKFEGTHHETELRKASSAMEVAKMGRDRKRPLRADWEQVKDDIMRTAVRAKFTQHKSLQEILLSTGDAILVEHTVNDSYWGDGGDGSGKNMLGKILVEIREELKSGHNNLRTP
jgi:N-glycosidase YbiA